MAHPMDKYNLPIVKAVYKDGLNVFSLINKYRSISKLKPDIPVEVVVAICESYLRRKPAVQSQWPWFIKSLHESTRRYFAEQNVKEHLAIKKEPVRLKISIG